MSDHVIIQADSRQWLQEAGLRPDLQIDCIITDPPYWTLDKWRNVGTTTRLGGHKDKDKQDESKWFPTIDQNDLWECVCAMGDLLAKNAHCYIFCDHEVMPILLNWARESELREVFRYAKPLVWDKVAIGMGYHWRARHEYIVMLEKGKRRLNDLGRPDILTHKAVRGRGHYPTEKPVSVVEELLLNSTTEGETVLDPFCGSGVVGKACDLHGRNSILVDSEERAVKWTRERLFGSPEELFCEKKGVADDS